MKWGEDKVGTLERKKRLEVGNKYKVEIMNW
jgi:hypothetical protein